MSNEWNEGLKDKLETTAQWTSPDMTPPGGQIQELLWEIFNKVWQTQKQKGGRAGLLGSLG